MHKVYMLIFFTPLLQAMQTAPAQQTIKQEAEQLLASINTLKHATDAYLLADEFNNLPRYTDFITAKTDCITRHGNLFNMTRNRIGLSQREQYVLQMKYGQAMNQIERNNLN